MASLSVCMEAWSAELPEHITCLATSDNQVYLGGRDGLIYCIDKATLQTTKILGGNDAAMLGFAFGTYSVDQPFGLIPVLLSLDELGYLKVGKCLCAWSFIFSSSPQC